MFQRRRSIRRSRSALAPALAPVALAVALAVAGPGCGGPVLFGAVATAIGLSGDSNSGSLVDAPPALTVDESGLDRRVLADADLVPVPIVVTDDGGSPVTLFAGFARADAGGDAPPDPAFAAAPGELVDAGGRPVPLDAVRAAPEGARFTFVFDAGRALAGEAGDVRLLFRATAGGLPGAAVVTRAFLAGNVAPSVILGPAPVVLDAAGAAGSPAVIVFSIADPDQDPASIVVERALPGESFVAATAASGVTEALATSAEGTGHDFVWNSRLDLGPVRREGTLVRITAVDRFGDASEPALVGPFTIDNNEAPIVQVVDPGRGVDREIEVPLRVTLFDAEANEAGAIVQFAEGTAFPPLPPEIVDPEARRRILADPERRRLLRIVSEAPALRAGRVAAATATALGSHDFRDPTLGPRLAGRRILFLDGALAGTERTISAYDPGTATASLDAALPLAPAPGDRFLLDLRGGMTGLEADPAGVVHPISWDSVRDVGPRDPVVRLKVTPLDSEVGTPFETLPFALENAFIRRGPVLDIAAVGEFGNDVAPSLPIAAADVTGDGLADALVSDLEKTVVFAQTNAGGVAEAGTLPRGGGEIRAAASGSGPSFVAVQVPAEGELATLAILRGAGPGEGLAGVTEVGGLTRAGLRAFAIAVHDGSPLVVAASNVSVFAATPIELVLFAPGGTTATFLVPATPRPPVVAVALGDIFGGGGLDVVAVHEAGPGERLVSIFRDLRSASSPGSPLPQYGEEPPLALDVAREIPGESGFGVEATIAIGDLTGDGVAEIAIAHDGGLSLFTHGAGGELRPMAAPPSPLPLALSVAVADLDGDGRSDLIVGGTSRFPFAFALLAFLQTAAGGLGAPSSIEAVPAERLATGDLNGDGAGDLLFSSSIAAPTILEGRPPLAWEPALLSRAELFFSTSVGAVAALPDGRAELDYVIASFLTADLRLRVFAPDETGSLVAASPVSFGGFEDGGGFAIGDVTGDGLADLVATLGESPSILVVPRGPDGALDASGATEIPLPPGMSGEALLRIGDLDGDGRQDLLFVGSGAFVYLGAPGGGLTSTPAALAIDQAFAFDFLGDVALGDVDRDGRLDLLVAATDFPDGPPMGGPPPAPTGVLLTFHGSGSPGAPAFGRVEETSILGAQIATLALADLDADGYLDIIAGVSFVVGGAFFDRIAFTRGGPLGFGPATLIEEAFDSFDAAPFVPLDVDADGRLDILAIAPSASADTLDITAFLQDEEGGFGRTVRLPTRGSAGGFISGEAAFAVDLTGDGRPDVIRSPWAQPASARGRSGGLRIEGVAPSMPAGTAIRGFAFGPGPGADRTALGRGRTATGGTFSFTVHGALPGRALEIEIDAGPATMSAILEVTAAEADRGAVAGIVVSPLSTVAAAVARERAGGGDVTGDIARNANLAAGFVLSGEVLDVARGGVARAGPELAAGGPAALRAALLAAFEAEAGRAGVTAGDLAGAVVADLADNGVLDGSAGPGGVDPGRLVLGAFPAALLPPPALVSISPAEGPTDGGTAVRVTGTGFRAGTRVEVGGAAAGGVALVSPAELTARTPPGVRGDADVVAVNEDGQTAALRSGFRYFRGAGAIVVEPARVDLGPIAVGGVAQATVAIGNAGTATRALTVSALVVRPPFSVQGATAPLTIQPGTAVSVTVACRPLVPGSIAGALEVVSDDPDRSVARVALVATAAVPRSRIDLGPPAVLDPELSDEGGRPLYRLDLGQPEVDAVVTLALSVTNAPIAGGGVPLIVTDALATGGGRPDAPGPAPGGPPPGPPPLEIAGLPLSLAPGESGAVTLTYRPGQVVDPERLLVDLFGGESPGGGPPPDPDPLVTLALTARPVGAPVLTLEPGLLLGGPARPPGAPALVYDFGAVEVASGALPLRVAVRNRADATVPLAIDAIEPPAPPFTLAIEDEAGVPLSLAPGQVLSLGPGEALVLVVGFAPGVAGPASASIVIRSNDPRFQGPDGFAVLLAGAGVDGAGAAGPRRIGPGEIGGDPLEVTHALTVTVYDEATGAGLAGAAVAAYASGAASPLAVGTTDMAGVATLPLPDTVTAVDLHVGEATFGLRSFLDVSASVVAVGVPPTPALQEIVVEAAGGPPGGLIVATGYDPARLSLLTAQSSFVRPGGPLPEGGALLPPTAGLSRHGVTALRVDPFAILSPDGGPAILDAAFSGPLPIATAPVVVPLRFTGTPPPFESLAGSVMLPAPSGPETQAIEFLRPVIARVAVCYPEPASTLLGQTVGLGAGVDGAAGGAIPFTLAALEDPFLPFAAAGILPADAADLRVEVTVGDRSQAAAVRPDAGFAFSAEGEFVATTTGYVHLLDPATGAFQGYPASVDPPFLAIPRVVSPVDPAGAAPIRLPIEIVFGDVLGAGGLPGYYRIEMQNFAILSMGGSLRFGPPWIIFAPPAAAPDRLRRIALPDLPPAFDGVVPGGSLRWIVEANHVGPDAGGEVFRYATLRLLDVGKRRVARAVAAADFRTLLRPAISGVSPASVIVSDPPSPVSIFGANFEAGAEVAFVSAVDGSTATAVPAFVDFSFIGLGAPPPPPGTPPLTVHIRVTNPSGLPATLLDAFTYLPAGGGGPPPPPPPPPPGR